MKKKYQVAILIELFTIFIMISWSVMIFRMKHEIKASQTAEHMNEVISWYHSYELNAKGNSKGDLLEYLLSQKFPSYYMNHGMENYGLALELYDENGNVILQTTSRNLILIWETERKLTDENGQMITIPNYKEVIFLENHFSEEDLDQLMDFYYYEGAYKNEKTEGLNRRLLAVKWMSGYYNEQDEYVPVKIMFMDDNQKKLEFLLEKKESETVGQDPDICETVVCESDSPVQITCYFWNTREEVSEKAWSILHSEYNMTPQEIVQAEGGCGGGSAFDRAYYAGRINDNEAAGYAFASYVDVDDLTLHCSDIQYDIRNMVILCQAGACILILIYLYFQKKQNEMRTIHDTFLNAMAHEMKTPAAVMKNSIECIQAGIHPEKQAHYQDMIYQEANHLNHLLEQMLTYTRVNDSFYQMKQENCDLKALAEAVCEHYTAFMEARNITLHWQISGDGILWGDSCLLEMVLDNFVSNAVKFCTYGGNIRISIEEQGVCVYNDGKHIPKEYEKSIWEPLFKADISQNTDVKLNSSGMGLAISASVLKLHHAKYGSRNVQGGVEFYFEKGYTTVYRKNQ